jgi:hypothetical protein
MVFAIKIVAACARPAKALATILTDFLKIRAQLPYLGKQHDIRHLAQVADAADADAAAGGGLRHCRHADSQPDRVPASMPWAAGWCDGAGCGDEGVGGEDVGFSSVVMDYVSGQP